MGAAASVIGLRFGDRKKIHQLLLRYDDAHANVAATFRALRMDLGLQLRWLVKWEQMDTDGSKRLDYDEFREVMGLADDLWCRRIFSLFDGALEGSIKLSHFISRAPWLLVYDRFNTIEIAFRTLSRRGSTAFDAFKSVIDEQDIRRMTEERYPVLGRQRCQKRVVEILTFIDDDESGGISYDEFSDFCQVNLIFATLSHTVLDKIRENLWGTEFWEKETLRLRLVMEECAQDVMEGLDDQSVYIKEKVFHSETTYKAMMAGVNPSDVVQELGPVLRVTPSTSTRLAQLATAGIKTFKSNKKQLQKSDVMRHVTENVKRGNDTATQALQMGTTVYADSMGKSLEGVVKMKHLLHSRVVEMREQTAPGLQRAREATTKLAERAEKGQQLLAASAASAASTTRKGGLLGSSWVKSKSAKVLSLTNGTTALASTQGEAGATTVPPPDDGPYAMSPEESTKYRQVFHKLDVDNSGAIDGKEAAPLLRRSGLPRDVLFNVWKLADVEKDGTLNEFEWAVAMHLVMCAAAKSLPIPKRLPPGLLAAAWEGQGEEVIAKALTEAHKEKAEERKEKQKEEKEEERRRRTKEAEHVAAAGATTGGLEATSTDWPEATQQIECAAMDGDGTTSLASMEGGEEEEEEEQEASGGEDEEDLTPNEAFFRDLKAHCLLLAASALKGDGFDFSKDFPQLWHKVKAKKKEVRQEKTQGGTNSAAGTSRLYARLIHLTRDGASSRWKLTEAMNKWRLHAGLMGQLHKQQSTRQLRLTEGTAVEGQALTGGLGISSVDDLLALTGFGDPAKMDMHSMVRMKVENDIPVPEELRDEFQLQYNARLFDVAKNRNVPFIPRGLIPGGGTSSSREQRDGGGRGGALMSPHH